MTESSSDLVMHSLDGLNEAAELHSEVVFDQILAKQLAGLQQILVVEHERRLAVLRKENDTLREKIAEVVASKAIEKCQGENHPVSLQCNEEANSVLVNGRELSCDAGADNVIPSPEAEYLMHHNYGSIQLEAPATDVSEAVPVSNETQRLADDPHEHMLHAAGDTFVHEEALNVGSALTACKYEVTELSEQCKGCQAEVAQEKTFEPMAESPSGTFQQVSNESKDIVLETAPEVAVDVGPPPVTYGQGGVLDIADKAFPVPNSSPTSRPMAPLAPLQSPRTVPERPPAATVTAKAAVALRTFWAESDAKGSTSATTSVAQNTHLVGAFPETSTAPTPIPVVMAPAPPRDMGHRTVGSGGGSVVSQLRRARMASGRNSSSGPSLRCS